MGKLFGVEEEKSSRMMHCSAPTGAARAATIAIVAGLRARTLAAELRIPKRMFFKANQPSVLPIVTSYRTIRTSEKGLTRWQACQYLEVPLHIGHHRFHTLLANNCAGALSCDGSGNEYTFPRQRKSTKLMVTSLPGTRNKICLDSRVEIIDIEPSDNMPDHNCTSADPENFRWWTFSHKISHGI